MTVAYFVKYFNDEIILTVDEQNALIELRCKRYFAESDMQLSVLEEFAIQLSEQFYDYFTFDYLEV